MSHSEGVYDIELVARGGTIRLETFRGTRKACKVEVAKYRELHGDSDGVIRERWIGPNVSHETTVIQPQYEVSRG